VEFPGRIIPALLDPDFAAGGLAEEPESQAQSEEKSKDGQHYRQVVSDNRANSGD
jgi:hypothetical protein